MPIKPELIKTFADAVGHLPIERGYVKKITSRQGVKYEYAKKQMLNTGKLGVNELTNVITEIANTAKSNPSGLESDDYKNLIRGIRTLKVRVHQINKKSESNILMNIVYKIKSFFNKVSYKVLEKTLENAETTLASAEKTEEEIRLKAKINELETRYEFLSEELAKQPPEQVIKTRLSSLQYSPKPNRAANTATFKQAKLRFEADAINFSKNLLATNNNFDLSEEEINYEVESRLKSVEYRDNIEKLILTKIKADPGFQQIYLRTSEILDQETLDAAIMSAFNGLFKENINDFTKILESTQKDVNVERDEIKSKMSSTKEKLNELKNTVNAPQETIKQASRDTKEQKKEFINFIDTLTRDNGKFRLTDDEINQIIEKREKDVSFDEMTYCDNVTIAKIKNSDGFKQAAKESMLDEKELEQIIDRTSEDLRGQVIADTSTRRLRMQEEKAALKKSSKTPKI